ncbi:MAG: hypothetical protein QHI48_05580 [Bacteroidota bacterium]|nr:hypothetical protein [Bacteroidota bacterium]
MTERSHSPRISCVSPPLAFIENAGHVRDLSGRQRPDVLYLLDGRNAWLYFTARSVSFVFPGKHLEGENTRQQEHMSGRVRNGAGIRRIDMVFEGASAHPVVVPEDPLDVAVSFYTPAATAGVRVERVYRTLRYRGIYEGIDLLFTVKDDGVKYAFIIRPGGRISDIRIRYLGAGDVSITPGGTLQALSPEGVLDDSAPVAWTSPFPFSGTLPTSLEYCTAAERSAPVLVDRVLEGCTTRFRAAPYDGNSTLVIDPFLQWSTYFGGSAPDYARAACMDAQGNLYIAGYTMSTDFPVTPGAFQGKNAGKLDVFVAKFDPSREKAWCTYYGGSGEEESPRIAPVPAGGVVVSGNTTSDDFPVSAGAFQPHNNGKTDMFLLKLDAEGVREWATYFGGGLSDECAGLAVSRGGDIAIAGGTFSTNFPVSRGAFQTINTGDFDAVVARFSPAGARIWATYIGGWGMDFATSVVFAGNGELCVAGYTESQNFPVSSRAAQGRYGGGPYDMFVGRFTETGSLAWVTYCGGSREDRATSVTTDRTGRIIVIGQTESGDFPGLEKAGGQGTQASIDAVVVEMDVKGTIVRSQRFGGRGIDIATAHVVDDAGNVIIVGQTESVDFPVTHDAFQQKHGGASDVFLARFNAAGSRVFSTYFGGRDQDIPYGIAVEANGNIIVTGITSSTDFFTRNASQRKRAGYTDAFLLRVVFDEPVANAGPDTMVCLGSSVQIGRQASRGKPPYRFAWKPSTALSDPTAMSPLAAPRKTTVYELTVMDAEGATGTDSVTVRVVDPPRVNAGKDRAVCKGDSVVLAAHVSGGLSPYWYSWSPATGLSATDVLSPRVFPGETTRFTLTVRDMNGCVASDSVLVTVFPPVEAHAGDDVTICAGSETTLGLSPTGGKAPYTYRWSPAEGLSSTSSVRPTAKPDRTTTYSLEVTDANGCVGRDTVTVRILERIRADAGPDRSICPGERVRLGGTTPTGRGPFRYEWTPVAGLNSATVPDPIAYPVHTTDYVLTVTDANGCTGSDTVRVSVNSMVRVDAGADMDLCEGNRVRIGSPAEGGTPPYTYAWTPARGLSSPSDAQPLAAPTETERYVVTVTDANGCTARDTVVVSVHAVPRVKTDPDFSICRGSRRKITATVRGGQRPIHFRWTPQMGLSAYDVPNPIASPDTTTVYIVTATDANGCTSTDTIVITVRPCSRADAGADVEICAGSETALGGEPADPMEQPQYFWMPATGLSAANRHRTTAKPRETTTYILRVTNMYGCESLDTVTVTVHPGPIADAGPPVAICERERTVIGHYASGGLPPYSYSWQPEAGLDDPHEPRPTAQPQVSTSYILTVTDARGCASSDTVPVTVRPVPIAEAGRDMEICSGTAVRLGAAASGGRGPFIYSWTPAFGLDDPRSAGPVATPPVTTVYHLTVTNAEGCSAHDSVLIVVHASPSPRIRSDGPTTFCEGENVTLDAGGDYKAYSWSDGSTTRSVNVRSSGEYRVTAIDEFGCRGVSEAERVRVIPLPRPRIVVLGRNALCEGESVSLDAGAGYASYRWSTGDTARVISVGREGTYTVSVTNAEGCEASADPVVVTVRPRPRPIVSRCRDTLTVTPAASYQWLVDGKPLRGAVNRECIADRTGSYAAVVRNAEGCSAQSDPVDVVIGSCTAALGRKTARRGDTVHIALECKAERELDRSGAVSFEASIRVRKGELALLDSTLAVSDEDGTSVIMVRGTRTPGSPVLARIPFRAPGKAGRFRLSLVSFRWLDGTARAVTRDGEVRVIP